MLTEEHRGELDRLGFTRLPAAIGGDEVARMRSRLWSLLEEKYGARRDAPATWTLRRPARLQSLHKANAFAAMASPNVCAALDDLFGTGQWARPQRWGQALVTFPSPQGRWDVPVRDWHTDAPARASTSGCDSVVLFAYLDNVPPRGGGTVVVAGSHHLAQRVAATSGTDAPCRSAEIRAALAESEPWIAALFDPDRGRDRVADLMSQSTATDGTPIRVAELTGEPGDVMLMDMRLLHAAAPNVAASPRLMVTQHIYRGA